MRLLLVRHGATENNAQARYTGQSDVPLSPLGMLQAEAVSRYLMGARLDAIVSSDLRRARSTAEAVARHHRITLIFDEDLREISLGEWEGLTYAEVLQRDPERAASWHSGRPESLVVAPPGGETTHQFLERILRAFDRWQNAYSDPLSTIVWVTHGGVIGILLCHLLGMDLNRRWQFRRDNGAVTELDVGRDSRRALGEDVYYAVLMRQNDTSHLAGIDPEESDQSEETQVL
jgi:broad specificity phosphatase PhoE